jgi:hypothetical protein
MTDSYFGSCIHQAGDDIVDGDDADGATVVVEDGEHAEIVFVEQFEDVFFVGVGGDGDERVGLELGHALFDSCEKDTGDRNCAGEMAELVENDDGIKLLEIEFLFAEPLEDFFASGRFTDEGEFGIHHAARG